jgi:hypothetical protein
VNILALDPGTTQTGWAIVADDMRVIQHGIEKNSEILEIIRNFETYADGKIATEMIASYGMPVGREVFETCIWIGRFIQAWRAPEEVIIIYRREVKMHLCGTTRAKDTNVRQAIIDLYEPTGGGATPQIGTSKQPGPLYGVSSHVWPAIGVGIVAHHQSGKLKLPDTLPLYQTNGEEKAAPF